jgi:electron transport complex protein RnfE
MGVGFTLSLTVMGSLREILGAGTFFGITVFDTAPMPIFIMPAGGFFTLGIIIAVVYAITNKPAPVSVGCQSCPMAATCDSYNCAKSGDSGNTPNAANKANTPAPEGGNA